MRRKGKDLSLAAHPAIHLGPDTMLHRPRYLPAFTLIELVLVLGVMALLMAMAAPSLRGWGQGAKLRDATDQLLAATRFARAQAVATANVHRLAVDPTGTMFQVVEVTAEGDQPPAGEFNRAATLSPSLRLGILRHDGSGGDVEFYPNARLTPATLRLSSAWGETVELEAATPAASFARVSTGGVR